MGKFDLHPIYVQADWVVQVVWWQPSREHLVSEGSHG